MAHALRNIAIIAHVDHGKTTLVDQLLRQSGIFRKNQTVVERVMDSNDLEKERGITILAKNCAIKYEGIHINIVDTPGHSDFGAEVERALSMVEGVLLLVDAVDGPMPQTVFVTRKALELGLKPIVVLNKIDRQDASPERVINLVFDLFDKLGATEEQLDFPVVYTSSLIGYASLTPNVQQGSMQPLLEVIVQYVPEHTGDPDGPLQMQIASLDYSSYIGKIGVGRIHRGRIRPNMEVSYRTGPNGEISKSRITKVLKFYGLERITVNEAQAGDIVLVYGIEGLNIGTTIMDPFVPEALPLLQVDEPTLTMNFMVNTSPLSGREGRFVTSRQLRNRLEKELKSNIALRVTDTDDEKVFKVAGRGELHLTILLETMRREGYELAISRPRVIFKEIDGVQCEPFEYLTVDIESSHQGDIIEELGKRKGDLQDIHTDNYGRTRLEYLIPARGLIGFQNDFLTLTRGTGVLNHVFYEYAPVKEGEIGKRRNGVLISQDDGNSVAYALWKLQDRGRMFVSPGQALYEGMIIGIHSRDNDLVVNPIRGKQLTNIRASGNDESIRLVPPIQLTLEYAVEFIDDDELIEITPKSIRLRKYYLQENERKRTSRERKPVNPEKIRS